MNNDLTSPEWKQAIGAATNHMADHCERLLTRAHLSEANIKGALHYSLARIILVSSQEDEVIRADITKIKELTPAYYGGGSQYQMTRTGQFVFIEHINSKRRTHGSDPLILSSPLRGTNTCWVVVPTNGELNIVGDILIPKHE